MKKTEDNIVWLHHSSYPLFPIQSKENSDEDPATGERAYGRRLRQLHSYGARGQGCQAGKTGGRGHQRG